MARGIQILEEIVNPKFNWSEISPGDFCTHTNIGPIHVMIRPPNISVMVKPADNLIKGINKNFFSMKAAAEGLNKYLKSCGVSVYQVLKKEKSTKPKDEKK